MFLWQNYVQLSFLIHIHLFCIPTPTHFLQFLKCNTEFKNFSGFQLAWLLFYVCLFYSVYVMVASQNRLKNIPYFFSPHQANLGNLGDHFIFNLFYLPSVLLMFMIRPIMSQFHVYVYWTLINTFQVCYILENSVIAP